MVIVILISLCIINHLSNGENRYKCYKFNASVNVEYIKNSKIPKKKKKSKNCKKRALQLPKSPKTSDTLRKRKERDTNNSNDSSDVNGGGAKKPPSGSDGGNRRLSGSYSSSSLARLVAISGLEIYEKYSPANYKPNCELPRSSSALTEAEVVAVSSTSDIGGATTTNDDGIRNETTTNITLDRPRSRYSRLYSTSDETSSCSNNKNGDSSSNKNDNDLTSATSSKPHRSSYRERAAVKQQANALAPSTSASSVLSHSSSSGDVPTATFTLRSNRTPKTAVTKAEESVTLNNGEKSNNNSSSKGDSISRQGSKTNLNYNKNSRNTYSNDLENNLKELKLSNSSSGSGLYKDNSSGSITTFTMPLQAKKSLSTSNSSGHLSTLTATNDNDSELKRNHSANNLDVVDHCVPPYELKLNSVAAGGAEVCTSAMLKTLDTPITAKKVNRRRQMQLAALCSVASKMSVLLLSAFNSHIFCCLTH